MRTGIYFKNSKRMDEKKNFSSHPFFYTRFHKKVLSLICFGLIIISKDFLFVYSETILHYCKILTFEKIGKMWYN